MDSYATVQQPVCTIPENSATTSHCICLGTTGRASLAEYHCRGRDLIWLEKKITFPPFCHSEFYFTKTNHLTCGRVGAPSSQRQPSRLPVCRKQRHHGWLVATWRIALTVESADFTSFISYLMQLPGPWWIYQTDHTVLASRWRKSGAWVNSGQYVGGKAVRGWTHSKT